MNCECQVLSQVKHGRAIGLDKVGGVLQSPLKFLILLSGGTCGRCSLSCLAVETMNWTNREIYLHTE
ncbi:hypothetical protein ES319_A12G009700v1 [Gossypium barbadense]|uniref:Uncharacterized protein n=1 Tax=Gossypium barbadense TaxID=3634 RepID=A0A5J5T4H4_GOSBA|nr:hypothetical protein ES319_A12G009700v1 [Gossypium barbadense]